jgi:ABC-type antimicrobial peptide transport system permease subunit
MSGILFQLFVPDAPEGTQSKTAEYAAASPNYLRALKATLMTGRFFTDQDSAASKRVVVVDEAFVRKYLPRRSAIGRRILAGLPPREWEIVGVMRAMSSLLFGVSPNDQLTFAAVPVLLGMVAMAACFIPARRATRVSPVEALRY